MVQKHIANGQGCAYPPNWNGKKQQGEPTEENTPGAIAGVKANVADGSKIGVAKPPARYGSMQPAVVHMAYTSPQVMSMSGVLTGMNMMCIASINWVSSPLRLLEIGVFYEEARVMTMTTFAFLLPTVTLERLIGATNHLVFAAPVLFEMLLLITRKSNDSLVTTMA